MPKSDETYQLVESVDEVEVRDGILHITAIVAGRTRMFALGPTLAKKVLSKLTKALTGGVVMPFRRKA